MSVETAIIRIKAYARHRGWTRNRLAAEAGIADTVLRFFERPDWNPTVATLRKLESVIPPEFEGREQEMSRAESAGPPR